MFDKLDNKILRFMIKNIEKKNNKQDILNYIQKNTDKDIKRIRSIYNLALDCVEFKYSQLI